MTLCFYSVFLLSVVLVLVYLLDSMFLLTTVMVSHTHTCVYIVYVHVILYNAVCVYNSVCVSPILIHVFCPQVLVWIYLTYKRKCGGLKQWMYVYVSIIYVCNMEVSITHVSFLNNIVWYQETMKTIFKIFFMGSWWYKYTPCHLASFSYFLIS